MAWPTPTIRRRRNRTPKSLRYLRLRSQRRKGRVAPATCDINSLLSKVKPATLLPVDELSRACARLQARRGQVRRSWRAPTRQARQPQAQLCCEGDIDPYVGFEARVVPENITLLPKKTAATDWSERWPWRRRTTRSGSILRELGAAPDEIKALIAVLGRPARDGGLKEGQKLRVLMTPAGLGHMRPLRVIIAGESAIEAAAALSDAGKFVAVDVRNVATEVAEADEEATEDDGSGVRLYQALTRRRCAQCAEPGDRGIHPRLLLRCRLPAQGACREFLRPPLFRGPERRGPQ